jgi:hypothetical protein
MRFTLCEHCLLLDGDLGCAACENLTSFEPFAVFVSSVVESRTYHFDTVLHVQLANANCHFRSKKSSHGATDIQEAEAEGPTNRQLIHGHNRSVRL